MIPDEGTVTVPPKYCHFCGTTDDPNLQWAIKIRDTFNDVETSLTLCEACYKTLDSLFSRVKAINGVRNHQLSQPDHWERVLSATREMRDKWRERYEKASEERDEATSKLNDVLEKLEEIIGPKDEGIDGD